jgi:hypothetical protein
VRRALLAAAAAAVLAGCPEERPGTEKRIPGERVPPAVAVDPAPSPPVPGRAGVAPDGGVSAAPEGGVSAARADGGARR